jgi:phage protein D/phage baseplate assembly protein gpV
VAEGRRLDQALVTLGGQRLPAELYARLTLVRVEESVHLPDAFVLRFDDPHFELFDRMAFSMGTKVEVAFSAEGDPVTVTRGEVTAISVEQGSSGRHELVVSGFDVAHRLARGPKTRSFQNMTDADIVSQVASEYGFETDIDATNEVYEYVIQSSESDYAFLKRRAERIGFDMWVADDRFFFKKAPRSQVSPPALKWGTNLHKFKVRFSSTERCDEVTVRGWDPVRKASVVGRATEGDPGATCPAASDLGDAARSAFGEVKRFAGQFPVKTQSEADALARSLLLRASGDEVVARGEAAGDPLIAAGATVEIASVGEKLAGTYRITSAEHIYGTGTPYVTRFHCGGKDPSGLADLFGSGGASGEKRGWGSLVIGLVTNADDPEALGRVKVKFPSLSDQDESAWAKVASPGAGNARGMSCVPEVGDEVLVGFEHEDKHRPVVLGGLWNSTDPPPDLAIQGGRVMNRVWASRNGHRVEFKDDDQDKGSIVIHHAEANSALTLAKQQSVLEADSSLSVTGRDIDVTASGTLTLKARTIEIKADTEVKVSGAQIQLN